MEQIICNFLWHSQSQSRVHWVNWDDICRTLEEGGLGIRRMSLIQDCLHGKCFKEDRYGQDLQDPNFFEEERSSISAIALLFGNPLSNIYPVSLNYRNGLWVVEILVSGPTTGLERLYMAINPCDIRLKLRDAVRILSNLLPIHLHDK